MTSTMKALRANPGDKKPTVQQINVPDVGDQDVLIRVASAGFAPGMLTLLEMGRLNHLPMTSATRPLEQWRRSARQSLLSRLVIAYGCIRRCPADDAFIVSQIENRCATTRR